MSDSKYEEFYKEWMKPMGNGFTIGGLTFVPTEPEHPDKITDGYFVCQTCRKRVERGIGSVSNHWVNCSGKAFTEELLKIAGEGKLTEGDVEILGEKHLKNGI